MLEQLVRPFQTPATILDKATPVTKVTKAATQKAILVWGAVGQPPETFSVGLTTTSSSHTFKEIKRKTTDIRIENPDDPNQYIIAQRIDSIQFTPTVPPGTSASLTSYATPTSTGTLSNPTVSDNAPASTTDPQSSTYNLTQPTT